MEDSPVFDQCVFCVVPSRDVPEEYALEARKSQYLILRRSRELTQRRIVTNNSRKNGAEVSELKVDGRIRLDEVTHIISTSSDFPQYDLTLDYMIPVVTPAWIKSSLLRNKQAPVRSFTPDPRLFFSGVTVSCAGLPESDKDAIFGAVVAMGGQESSHLTKLVTHIVALTEDHPKCQQVLEKKMKCKIVLPHWFDDCFKLGKRIDENPYLLPDPEVLRKFATDSVTVPNSSQMEGATSPRPKVLPTPTDIPNNRKLHVFNAKKVMLSEDLSLGSRLRGIIEDLIEGGGGAITTTIHKADIYVCHFRDGKDYVTASRRGKDVGNLAWLYQLITHNEWTSPLRRLLHYPVPRNGIPGFENFRISLSNYGGEARMYLENLVIAAGADFTKTMRQENTHLVTARAASEKCDAAREWSIDMINHLWIEESYAKCKVQPLSNTRYTHFPPRTNLGEVIGQTRFDRDALERIYFPEDLDESPERFESPGLHRMPRSAMPSNDSNATLARGENAFAEDYDESNTLDFSRISPRHRSSSASSSAPTSSHISAAHTPHINRLALGKENETPSSTGSRSAKNRALSKLQDMAPDIALYMKEKKRGGGGVWGGKRAADSVDREMSRKRTSSSVGVDEDDDAGEEEHESKRARSGAPPIEMRLLITNYKRWIDFPSKEEAEKKKLREMGVFVTLQPYNCTHIAAPCIVRTQKFLCALAVGATILSSDFIDSCLEQGEMLQPGQFLLKDLENEKRFKMKLNDAVKRARINGRRLLEDVAICCTPHINNGVDTFMSIVKANGGSFFEYRGHGGFVLKNEDDEDFVDEPIYLLSGTKPEEKTLWPKFEEMARKGRMQPRIVITEWLLDTAMSQEMRWDEQYLIINALARGWKSC